MARLYATPEPARVQNQQNQPKKANSTLSMILLNFDIATADILQIKVDSDGNPKQPFETTMKANDILSMVEAFQFAFKGINANGINLVGLISDDIRDLYETREKYL